MNKKIKNKIRVSPFIFIFLSFLIVIFIGSFLLWLPISQTENRLSYLDSLFLSTSAICVTGLTPVSNLAEHLSIFGKVILSILIEIGGLGIVSIMMFIAILFGFKITFNQRSLLKEALNQNEVGGIVSMLIKIVSTALIIQFVGFILNFISLYFIEHLSFAESLGYGLFHAISSFNNAGFDLFGSSSLINYSNNYLLMFSTCLMIFLGGIGFIVIFDIIQKRSIRKLSLHSKIVLTMSTILLVVGTLLIKLLNFDSISLHDAIFLSFSLRTAGFTTIDLNNLSLASQIIMFILMFVGAGSASTGGGIKVSTFFVLILAFKNFAQGNKDIHVFKRQIPNDQVSKAFILTSFSIFFIMIISTLLATIEKNNFNLLQILFEVISGFGTVGLSLGVTPLLSVLSKLIICVTMFTGRLGPLLFISLFHQKHEVIQKDQVGYVEENVIIG